MNTDQARFNMVEQQIRTWEVLNQDVLDLLFVVRREDFAPAGYRNLAFSDSEIPLGHGATMLAPRIEARALQALQLRRHEKVLEIGAGSGYMAALLAAHAEHVWSMEIQPDLVRMAQANVRRAGIGNVSIELGDGMKGMPERAPFDVIVVSGAVPKVPEALLKQLRIGGRLFAIVGEAPVMEAQLTSRSGENSWNTVNLFETVTGVLENAPRGESFAF